MAMLPQTWEPERINCAIRNEENRKPRVREKFVTLPSREFSPVWGTQRQSKDQGVRNRADPAFCTKCIFSPSKRTYRHLYWGTLGNNTHNVIVDLRSALKCLWGQLVSAARRRTSSKNQNKTKTQQIWCTQRLYPDGRTEPSPTEISWHQQAL